MPREGLIGAFCVAALIALVAVGLWQTGGTGAPAWGIMPHRLEAVMGTDGTLAAVVRPAEHRSAADALREAEHTLRTLEAQLSAWLDRSEVGRFNRAGADVEVPLSASTMAVLHAARRAYAETGGAFDVTCLPQIELWRQAAQSGRPPANADVAAARAASNWSQVRLTDAGAVKEQAGVELDLGGIAKGYAIDRAVETLKRHGLRGALVNLGGDIRCFGPTPSGEPWTIDLQDPFGHGKLGSILATDVAVCTSGGYQRYFEVDGRRRSHILDPRTGQPSETASSVTVIGPDALTADIWATALSVLGPEGLDLLPGELDALIVAGDKTHHRVVMTDGFRRRFRSAGEQ